MKDEVDTKEKKHQRRTCVMESSLNDCSLQEGFGGPERRNSCRFMQSQHHGKYIAQNWPIASKEEIGQASTIHSASLTASRFRIGSNWRVSIGRLSVRGELSDESHCFWVHPTRGIRVRSALALSDCQISAL